LLTRKGSQVQTLSRPALEESLDLLQDDELMESLRTSRRQAADGDTVPLRDQV
jgi:PHD/YefM family antitoxin component YafN of YafNO toxin-antitoxin module